MKKNGLFKALLILILVYVVLSWFVPVGYFSNGSFVKDAVSPVGIFDFIIYPLVTATSSVFVLTAIVFLLIGGFYGVVNKTGIYSNLLQSLAKKWKGKENNFSCFYFNFYCFIIFNRLKFTFVYIGTICSCFINVNGLFKNYGNVINSRWYFSW